MTDHQSAPMGEQELIALADRLAEQLENYASKQRQSRQNPIFMFSDAAKVLRELVAVRAAASPRLAKDHLLKAADQGIISWNTAQELDRFLSLLGPAPSESVGCVPDGYVLVPQKALDWLNGAGPDDNGKWFGELADEVEELDKPRRFKRTYWWRTYFRQMIDASKLSSQVLGGDE